MKYSAHNSEETTEKHHTLILFRPFYWAETKCFHPLKSWLNRWAIFDILDRLGKGVIVISLLFYVSECSKRKETALNTENEAIYQAWQTVTAATGKEGDLGRTRALGFLVEKGESIERIDLSSGVVLKKVALQGANAYQINLKYANLSGADLRGADFTHAILDDAILEGADLRGVTIDFAEMYRTKLDGAIVDSKSWVNSNSVDKGDTIAYGLYGRDWNVRLEKGMDGSDFFVIRKRN